MNLYIYESIYIIALIGCTSKRAACPGHALTARLIPRNLESGQQRSVPNLNFRTFYPLVMTNIAMENPQNKWR